MSDPSSLKCFETLIGKRRRQINSDRFDETPNFFSETFFLFRSDLRRLRSEFQIKVFWPIFVGGSVSLQIGVPWPSTSILMRLLLLIGPFQISPSICFSSWRHWKNSNPWLLCNCSSLWHHTTATTALTHLTWVVELENFSKESFQDLMMLNTDP